jgi:phosphohistidine phosphatase
MGRIIAERGESVDLVLVSTSRRTRDTWRGVKGNIQGKPEVRELRSIYDADSTYLEILRREGGSAQSLMLVGHNPAIQETAVSLGRDQDGEAHGRVAAEFPTGALAIFEFDGDWRDLKPGTAEFVAFLTPGEDATG